jgi:hypothetical protein
LACPSHRPRRDGEPQREAERWEAYRVPRGCSWSGLPVSCRRAERKVTSTKTSPSARRRKALEARTRTRACSRCRKSLGAFLRLVAERQRPIRIEQPVRRSSGSTTGSQRRTDATVAERGRRRTIGFTTRCRSQPRLLRDGRWARSTTRAGAWRGASSASTTT